MEKVPKIEEKCRLGTIEQIAWFYYQMRANPTAKTLVEIRREEYEKCGIAGVKDMSDAELQAAMDDDSWLTSAEVTACMDKYEG